VDLLAGLFLFCFAFGVAFTALSFLAGPGLHGLGHGLGHAHLVHMPGAHGAGGHPGLAAEQSAEHHWTLGSLHLSPATLAVFLAWFGGVGFATYTLLGLVAALCLLAATVAGLVGAGFVTLYLVRLLLPGQTFLEEVVGPGTVARVSRDIRSGGIGEIVYTLGGTRHSDGARAEDGGAIARGTEVVITRLERGIAYVQPWSVYVSAQGQREEGR